MRKGYLHTNFRDRKELGLTSEQVEEAPEAFLRLD
jgi:hypothetical protein